MCLVLGRSAEHLTTCLFCLEIAEFIRDSQDSRAKTEIMLNYIWLIPTLPLAGSALIGLLGLINLRSTGEKLNKKIVSAIALGVRRTRLCAERPVWSISFLPSNTKSCSPSTSLPGFAADPFRWRTEGWPILKCPGDFSWIRFRP